MQNKTKLFRRKNKFQVLIVANGDSDQAYLANVAIFIIEVLRRIAPRSIKMAGDNSPGSSPYTLQNNAISYPVGEEVQTGPND
jgi:hypothetical protein